MRSRRKVVKDPALEAFEAWKRRWDAEHVQVTVTPRNDSMYAFLFYPRIPVNGLWLEA